MDRFLRSLFTGAGFNEKVEEIKEERLALVALGSYGRRELCLGSDVDLLVVYRGLLSPEMKDIVLGGLYPLWDANLDVGYSIQTTQECINLAVHDFKALTSFLDARFLFGSRVFYRLFEGAFWSRIGREKSNLLNQFLTYRQKREEKYSSQSYFVEPDIKEGLGGLRDLHFISWMAKMYFKSNRLNNIKRYPVFSHFGLEKLNHSKGFLLKVRTHLHRLADGRREDRLLLHFQKEISQTLGYGDHRKGTEMFMRDMYLHLNRVRYGREEFQVKALDILDPQPFEPGPEKLSPEFRVLRGNIVLSEGTLRKVDPALILKAFNEANRHGLSIGSGFIWQAKKLIAGEGRRFLKAPKAKEAFLNLILKPNNPKILRMALEIGLISLFIPEFKKVRNLAQYDYYHMETVDLHSLRTVEVMQDIAKGAYDEHWPLLREIFLEVENPDHLFLAGLLHDIGKGYEGDHTIAGGQIVPRILKRLDMDGRALEVIPFLVNQHLLLVRVSQRRDLNDEKTSVQVAQIIQDVESLRLLFLLTMADSIATGPLAHSDWKIMLLIELFFKVRHILERGTLASPDARKRLEDVRKQLIKQLEPHFSNEKILDVMDQASTRYYLNTPLEDMALHFRLALTLGQKRISWDLQKLKDAPVTRVILCTYDMPGLFSKMVGVFSLNNIKVLSANIFTLKNGLAFDVYEVTNPLDPYREERMWAKVKREALEAIDERMPLDELIRKKERQLFISKRERTYLSKKVKIDNDESDFFTIIEASAGNRIGLIYELAKEVFSLGLDIRFAKVNSDEETMTGVFYVRDSDGQKIFDSDQIDNIKSDLMSIVE